MLSEELLSTFGDTKVVKSSSHFIRTISANRGRIFSMNILAIETSCDDTSVAVVEDGSLVLSSIVSSQLEHSQFGGVVPEVAARAHVQNMIPVLDEALKTAEITMDDIDAFAVTKGPGLIGSLIVGVNTAKTLAYLYNKPLVAIHHTEGHIYANWLHKDESEAPEFPLVCLTVSGGHTNLIYMKGHLDYEIIGETQDDAAGEAFDKVAKMLGLGYPGGPLISRNGRLGNPEAFDFPRVDLTGKPTRDENSFLVKAEESLDFSYSGLKTAVLRVVKELMKDGKELTQGQINDIAASFEAAATDMLTRNLMRAVIKYKPKSVLLSGGVAANLVLREKIGQTLSKDYPNAKYYFPELKCCTDNAAMIAAASYYHAQKKDFTNPETLVPDSNLKLT
jgi:N6-L-threonylcarbamoyladenine synthase